MPISLCVYGENGKICNIRGSAACSLCPFGEVRQYGFGESKHLNTPAAYNVKPARTPAVDNAVLENKPYIGSDNLFGNVADSVNFVEIKNACRFRASPL